MHDLQKTLKKMSIVVNVNASDVEKKSMLFDVVNLDFLVEKSYVLRWKRLDKHHVINACWTWSWKNLSEILNLRAEKTFAYIFNFTQFNRARKMMNEKIYASYVNWDCKNKKKIQKLNCSLINLKKQITEFWNKQLLSEVSRDYWLMIDLILMIINNASLNTKTTFCFESISMIR